MSLIRPKTERFWIDFSLEFQSWMLPLFWIPNCPKPEYAIANRIVLKHGPKRAYYFHVIFHGNISSLLRSSRHPSNRRNSVLLIFWWDWKVKADSHLVNCVWRIDETFFIKVWFQIPSPTRYAALLWNDTMVIAIVSHWRCIRAIDWWSDCALLPFRCVFMPSKRLQYGLRNRISIEQFAVESLPECLFAKCMPPCECMFVSVCECICVYNIWLFLRIFGFSAAVRMYLCVCLTRFGSMH